jgi:EpsD family peptidyl-prolyl cis-trans isomerase
LSYLPTARHPVRRTLALRRGCIAVMVVVAAGVAGCGDKKEQKSGQALVSVNGAEITTLQLNDEMQRANVTPAQLEAAKKQVLESLVERQLLQNAAQEEKLDRDPKVVQAMERAKALVIAQAYMQKHVGQPARPTRPEMQAYFDQHPQFFSERKQFEMRQLIVATSDLTPELNKVVDGAKTLDEVAEHLGGRNIKFARNQLARTSADLPPELTTKLLAMPKGQLFIIREGPRSVLSTITDIKDAPVTFDNVAPQIEQYLVNAKGKEAAAAELKRLRAAAKVEYLNKAMAPSAPTAPAPAAPAPAPSDAAARGVSGLK